MTPEYQDPQHRPSPEAREAADIAVRKTFSILGVDVNDAKSIEEFREDLRFGRRLRRAADRSALAFWGTLGVAVAYALFWGVAEGLRKAL